MKYVKLTARPDTWFKAGTEVYDYDKEYSAKIRVPLEYWEECKSDGGHICVRGIRIAQWECETTCGHIIGDEYVDGEWCSCDEFDVEIVDGN
jgi:hypothetical protein